jgi:ribokinase
VQLIAGAGAVLLQREIPEAVNIHAAQLAAAAGVPVLLDAGGVDAPLSDALLQLLTTISPNETELQRLTGQQADSEAQALLAAVGLQQKAAQLAAQQQGSDHDEQQQQQQQAGQGQAWGLRVLVKRGSAGSMMVGAGGQQEAMQPAIPAAQVVDTTGVP